MKLETVAILTNMLYGADGVVLSHCDWQSCLLQHIEEYRMKNGKKTPLLKKVGIKVLAKGTKNARFSKLGKDSCCGSRY